MVGCDSDDFFATVLVHCADLYSGFRKLGGSSWSLWGRGSKDRERRVTISLQASRCTVHTFISIADEERSSEEPLDIAAREDAAVKGHGGDW